MIRSAEGRRNIVDSDDKTFDYDNPLFGHINGAPRYEIYLYLTPTKKRRKKRDGTETQYLLQGKSRSAGRRRHMCVRIVRTPMQSKMKFGSATLRKTVPVLHNICMAHMTLSAKYIMIESCFLVFMPSMHHYC